MGWNLTVPSHYLNQCSLFIEIIPQPPITKVTLKFTYLKFHSNFPEFNVISWWQWCHHENITALLVSDVVGCLSVFHLYISYFSSLDPHLFPHQLNPLPARHAQEAGWLSVIDHWTTGMSSSVQTIPYKGVFPYGVLVQINTDQHSIYAFWYMAY